jgi:hypothetical protein
MLAAVAMTQQQGTFLNLAIDPTRAVQQAQQTDQDGTGDDRHETDNPTGQTFNEGGVQHLRNLEEDGIHPFGGQENAGSDHGKKEFSHSFHNFNKNNTFYN